MKIVGREKEKSILNKILKSPRSEFVVSYGRRRIGKTYLLREYFRASKCEFMHCTGVRNAPLQTQIQKFTEALATTFYQGAPLQTPSSWDDAFKLLQSQVEQRQEKVVIFLDELPWLATAKSDLLATIDYYWNHYWSAQNNVILIACGSSASWIIKKIINDKGGLHNRMTRELPLAPFNLHETKAFLQAKKIKLINDQILEIYMATGGVPYYLDYIENGLSAAQNIQALYFAKNAPLKNEFDKLFASLFTNAPAYVELVKIIAKKREGVTRATIKSAAKLSEGGGRLSERLNDLVLAGFISMQVPWGKKRGEYYKLTDEFALFYLRWLDNAHTKSFTKNHWLEQRDSAPYHAWAGYAFEAVCHKHIDQIVDALNIPVGGMISSWRFTAKKPDDTGAQIDILIDRNDNAISIGEIKHYASPYRIDKVYYQNIMTKLDVFRKQTKTQKQLFFFMVTKSGLRPSIYSEELVTCVVTLRDLFCKGE